MRNWRDCNSRRSRAIHHRHEQMQSAAKRYGVRKPAKCRPWQMVRSPAFHTAACKACLDLWGYAAGAAEICDSSGITSEACMPLGPCTISNRTRWPSFRLRNPCARIAEKCTKTSAPPPSGVMNPKPLASLNHLTVPTAIRKTPLRNDRFAAWTRRVVEYQPGFSHAQAAFRDAVRSNREKCTHDLRHPPRRGREMRVDLAEADRRVWIGTAAGRPIRNDGNACVIDAALARQRGFRHARHADQIATVAAHPLDFLTGFQARPLRGAVAAAIYHFGGCAARGIEQIASQRFRVRLAE